MKLTKRPSSETSTPRSKRTTGISASLASFRTSSKPVATTGEKEITSTPLLMKLRMALIWFSCFCWASENVSSMLARFSASPLMDSVLALRQSDSAPTWEKPTLILELSLLEHPVTRSVAAAAAMMTVANLFMLLAFLWLLLGKSYWDFDLDLEIFVIRFCMKMNASTRRPTMMRVHQELMRPSNTISVWIRPSTSTPKSEPKT